MSNEPQLPRDSLPNDPLQKERSYLANLLEAIQRCTYFLSQSESKLTWPLSAEYLAQHKKDVDLFETMAAVNERFAKLQDSLAAAMRHTVLLMGEPNNGFLKTLAVFEKYGVIESTVEWQRSRASRNLAAHDYETDYTDVAEHFNTLHELSGILYGTAQRLLNLCGETLGVKPVTDDFDQEFRTIVEKQ
jgi:uncharacterized protein with HEPN domain